MLKTWAAAGWPSCSSYPNEGKDGPEASKAAFRRSCGRRLTRKGRKHKAIRCSARRGSWASLAAMWVISRGRDCKGQRRLSPTDGTAPNASGGSFRGRDVSVPGKAIRPLILAGRWWTLPSQVPGAIAVETSSCPCHQQAHSAEAVAAIDRRLRSERMRLRRSCRAWTTTQWGTCNRVRDCRRRSSGGCGIRRARATLARLRISGAPQDVPQC